MSKPFVHLHVHSHYSLLAAVPRIPQLVAKAKEFGMPALALTDDGNLYGAIEFYKECKEVGIKPIIGVDFYFAPRTRLDKEHGVDGNPKRLVLLAENLDGYHNLIKLVTASYIEGFFDKPRIDRELMGRYSKGLIAIIPQIDGEVSNALQGANHAKAEAIVTEYREIFGPKNVFLEIVHHPELGENARTEAVVEFGRKNKIPLLAAHDVRYLSVDDARARATLLSIAGHPLSNEEEDFSFVSGETMAEYFKDVPEALENANKVAERCDLKLELGKWVFPDLKLKKNLDGALRELVYEGVKSRKLVETPEVKTRIDYELELIKKKGFSGYFLVVADLLRYAREHDILTTTRGSVGGSIVSYLTYITTVNPLEYKLPFERFLNPERPSAPDIDMDIADDRREEMIEYAKKKYGHENVAQIGTFGTMMARAAVRDVARALGYSYGEGDRIAKLIPMGSQGFPMTIDHAFELVPELKKIYDDEDSVRDIIDMAKKIEGNARHVGVHAAGVVISPTALTDFTPLQPDPKGEAIITQYDMYSIEEAGLLKFDFLGLKNLTIIAYSVKLVKKLRGIDIDIENIPLDDKKTFEMLAKGETAGLFQLNGSGLTRFLKDLRPTDIHDINAMVALYRPGPMEVIPKYIRRKNGLEPVSYPDPRMEKYLKESYGLIVYQDDLLLSAIELAGYSWLEADKFRKAVGKKIPAEMAAQKENLIKGIIKNGQTAQFAEMLWHLFEPFQAYGFNKAHAASYGKVAYQTAYMKANFPGEYMTAVLTAESGDLEAVAEMINECRRIGIEIMPPSVNESFKDFAVLRDDKKDFSKDRVRFGLGTIKNFGEGIAESIVAERKKGGTYKSVTDFLERVKEKNLNKKSLEALIKTGALDELGVGRATLLANLDALLNYHREKSKAADSASLFGESKSEIILTPVPPASAGDKLAWEKELLGFYISGHPLDKYRKKLEENKFPIKRVREEMKQGMETMVAGIIENSRAVTTKGGARMAFIRVADFTGSIEVVFFPKIYEESKLDIAADKLVAIKGRFSERNGEPSVVAEAIKAL